MLFESSWSSLEALCELSGPLGELLCGSSLEVVCLETYQRALLSALRDSGALWEPSGKLSRSYLDTLLNWEFSGTLRAFWKLSESSLEALFGSSLGALWGFSGSSLVALWKLLRLSGGSLEALFEPSEGLWELSVSLWELSRELWEFRSSLKLS